MLVKIKKCDLVYKVTGRVALGNILNVQENQPAIQIAVS
jgi:hypothetical protein